MMRIHEVFSRLDASSSQVMWMLFSCLVAMVMFIGVWASGNRQNDAVRSAHGAGLVLGIFVSIMTIFTFAYFGGT